MNRIDMLFQQTTQPSLLNNNGQSLSNEEDLLRFNQTLSEILSPVEKRETEMTDGEAKLLHITGQEGEIGDSLVVNRKGELVDELSSDAILQEVKRLLDMAVQGRGPDQDGNEAELALTGIAQGLMLGTKVEEQNPNASVNWLVEMVTQSIEQLSLIDDVQDIKKIAPKILELLQQTVTIEKKTPHFTESVLAKLDSVDAKSITVWKELLQIYQNRTQLSLLKTSYVETSVTAKDVAKWLTNLLKVNKSFDNQAVIKQGFYERVQGKQVHVDRSTFSIPTFFSASPMSKVEQYVVYVNPNQASSQPVGEQMIEHIQHIVKRSQFLTLPTGKNMMSISFRPEHLGHLHIRLIEMNGEMTVKILVTSQTAQKALESNIHQLKHLFAPHQVVIERQDVQVQPSQDFLNEHDDDQQQQEQKHQQSEESSNQNRKSELDFSEELNERMLSEKV